MNLTAQLGSPHPYAHEIAQGHWDIPKDVIEADLLTHMPTNRKLFKDFPDWALIVVLNPAHTYDVQLPGEERCYRSGVWWVWEAHPNMQPREWGPAFPLLFREHDDGQVWVDRACGKPANPQDCYPLIVKTLKFKDIFNTGRFKELGDNIREADQVAEAAEKEQERKLKMLRESFLRDEVNDQSTVKGGSKEFVPSTYEPTSTVKKLASNVTKFFKRKK